jgi:hypothetical protein
VLVSGSGNVAQYTVDKLIDLGAKVLTLSDSDGYIYVPEGITREQWEFVMELKNINRGRIREFAEKYGCKYVAGARPWHEVDEFVDCVLSHITRTGYKHTFALDVDVLRLEHLKQEIYVSVTCSFRTKNIDIKANVCLYPVLVMWLSTQSTNSSTSVPRDEHQLHTLQPYFSQQNSRIRPTV